MQTWYHGAHLSADEENTRDRSHGLLTESVEQATGKLGKQITLPGCPPDLGETIGVAMRQARKEKVKEEFQGRHTSTSSEAARHARVTIRHGQIVKPRHQMPSPRPPDLPSRSPESPLLIGRGNFFSFSGCQIAGSTTAVRGKRAPTGGSAPYPQWNGMSVHRYIRKGACCHVRFAQGSRCNSLRRRVMGDGKRLRRERV
ncbi:hypothetical protein B0I37DRAFT_371238 [Chaetomium sp. MPI-CAGE-AT-0009]|nr:hypothetical protein B0I37DRAFT_371238 [Chaetomium sp. MPI-CAGE-AT-0009]